MSDQSARSRGREMALQWLYAWEQNGYRDDGGLLTEEVTEDAPEGAFAFASRLVEGVKTQRTPVDAALDARLENWTLGRLALPDRNLLRLGAYELLYCEEVPPKVAINECVELAKRFGSEDKSMRLVNGVLDRIAREHRGLAERRPDAAAPAG